MSINSPEIAEARASIVQMAKEMLVGERSYIEGSRAILALVGAARVGKTDAFDALVAIDSETDQFPMGNIRKRWNSDALAKMQPDLEQAEQWAKDFGEPACHRLLDLFEAKVFPEF